MARVLVIDDCQEYLDRAKRILQCEGLEVIEARDVLAGLQRAVEDVPDLVLVSESLSGMNGLEVCERIANEPTSRGIPVLVMADADPSALRSRAMRAGAAAVALRGCRAAELRGSVRQSLVMAGVHWLRATDRYVASTR